MTFKSRKDWLFLIVSYGTIGLCLTLLIGTFLYGTAGAWELVFMTLIIAAVCWLLLSMMLGTSYRISEGHIYYKGGPFKGKVAIQSIREIQAGKSLWTGLRVATAMKGLIIKFGKYDEIYISPDSNERFLEELKKIQPDLAVKYG
ncbi:MAG: PH domain-containing protein [Flavobacteriales bacterium]